ncbi:MAG: hypothetical protein KAT16_03875 [Candidatus Heimdallarchaeota archaeon]|nr:hypothetical protein [Candidatus Heimdallarchaeota archaeon]
MNSEPQKKFFTQKFADKAEWNDFKVDLKKILREHQIKFQYSETVPSFHILYKSDQVRLQINWKEEILIVNLQTVADLTPQNLDACNEIFELLSLFSGELIEGTSPYDW